MEKAKTELAVAAKKPQPQNLDDELSELCRSMRLMSERDTDATLAQVLKAMLVHARSQPIGGSELSKVSGINRITIIHHLKRLEGAGFVQRQETKYVLRVRSAEDMLLEFRKDMERAFSEMDEMAREIDEQFASMEREFAPQAKRKREP
jgi:predicted transcriptional regulator